MSANSSLIVDGVNIPLLSDEELFEHLTARGAVVGPIVGTTRKTYERKLAELMGGTVSNYSFIDTSATAAPGSDEETDVLPSQAYIEKLSTGEPRARQRKPRPERSYSAEDQEEEEEEDAVEERVGYDSRHSVPLYSPSPRRPLHSPSTYPSSGGDESYLSSPLSSRLGASASPPSSRGSDKHYSSSPSATSKGAAGGAGQLAVKILVVVILAVLLYFFFVAKSEKDSFASLGQMAKTAADAVEKSKAGTDNRAGL